MFRLLHIGSKLGFNTLKDTLGFDHERPTDILRCMGGAVYQKAAQSTSATDPAAAVFSECVPWDSPQLQERLAEYCVVHGLDASCFEFVASGSIGGVFKWVGKGDPWVVKLQYTGIREQFEDDMRAIRSIGTLTLSWSKKASLDQMYTLFESEFDYDREQRTLDAVSVLWCDDDRFVVPSVLPARCADRAIAMSYVDGVPLSKFLAQPATTGDDRNRVAGLLFVFLTRMWSSGMVFADPHWGNFLVHPGATRLGVVDFGSIHHADARREMTMDEFVAVTAATTSPESLEAHLREHRIAKLRLDGVGETIFPAYSLLRRLLFTNHHFDEQTRVELKNAVSCQDHGDLHGTAGTVPVTRMLFLLLSMLTYMDVTINLGDLLG